jgi:hypothetical protein
LNRFGWYFGTEKWQPVYHPFPALLTDLDCHSGKLVVIVAVPGMFR